MAISIALNIVDAVDYMHSNNPTVIHLDLKPANVLVCTYVIAYACIHGHGMH